MATAAKKAVVETRFPKTVGQMVDSIQVLQEQAHEIKVALAAKEEQISAALEHLEANFDANEINGAKGTVGIAERKSQVVFTAKDWDKVYAYITKYKAFELLQKRLTTSAVAERFDNKKPIPGIEPFTRHFIVVKAVK